MRELLEDNGFHLQLILVGICWAFMGIYVYERIKEKKNKK
jgi:hypothetical protein